MKKSLGIIFSLEFAFALFLTIAYFKEGLTFVPAFIDLTFVFFLVTISGVAVRLIRTRKFKVMHKSTVTYLYVYIIFIMTILISTTYTNSYIYANEKLLKITVVTTWSSLGIFLIVNNYKSFLKLMQSFVIISAVMAIAGLLDLFNAIVYGYYNGRLQVFGYGYLALGRSVSLGLIILTCYATFSYKKKSIFKTIAILGVILMAFSIFASGARMPFISCLVTVMMLVLLSSKKHKQKFLIRKSTFYLMLFTFSVTLVTFLISLTGKLDEPLKRLFSLFNGRDLASIERLERFQVALEMFKNNILFGNGFGSFPLSFIGEDRKEYPHNIFLELLSEVGLMGFIPFCFLLIFVIYHGIFKPRMRGIRFHYMQLATIGMFLFFLMNANTTGDITDNKLLFTFVALMISATNLFKEKQRLESYPEKKQAS